MGKSTIKKDNIIYTKTIASANMTIAGGARGHIDLPTGLPNNTMILSILLVWSPHVDWVTTSVALGEIGQNQAFSVRYHNEHTNTFTGKWTFEVRYCYV